MSSLDKAEAFAKVVASRGFTAAARVTGEPRATLWRQVNQLEEELGVRLIERTTRSFRVTAEGQQLYERIAALLQDLRTALQPAALETHKLAGKVRVSAPNMFGRLVVVPILSQMALLHPELQLELVCTDRAVDLVDEGYDIAVRMGELPSSSFRALTVGQVSRVLCASSKYLAGRAPINVPSDIRGHRVITGPTPEQTLRLTHTATGKIESVHFKAAMTVTPMDAVVEAVKAGAGIAWLPEFVLSRETVMPSITVVLSDWRLTPARVNLLFPSTSGRPARTDAVLRYLADELKNALPQLPTHVQRI